MALYALAGLAIGGARPACAQQIFFGVADQWQPLLAHPESWPFVQRNADGFYVNFIMMNRLIRHNGGMSEATLRQTCGLFASHRAYLESDIRTPTAGTTGGGGGGKNDGASPEQESQYIQMLHQAGCSVPYTSLNYGWNAERAEHLTHFDLTEGHRLNFVQGAPWALGGNIMGPSVHEHPGLNENLRQWTRESDGIATDGPLGLWASDHKGFREADISIVHFAHAVHKKVMIMLAPFAAGQTQVYVPKRDLLATGQNMVRTLESAHAIPDIWVVFEYATDIPPVPEQVGGKPIDSMTGLAFWLIHHVHDPARWARLDPPAAASGTAQPIGLTLANHSDWLDVSPLLHLRAAGMPAGVTARLMLDGHDVTQEASAGDGLALTGERTLWPGGQHRLALQILRHGVPVSARAVLQDGATAAPDGAHLELTLAPSAGVPGEIHQRLVVTPLSPLSS
jgi:hypothetical protein